MMTNTLTVPGALDLIESYTKVRAETERLCAPLEIEDYGVQGMPDASPPKWHLAHTTWFFENFFLAAFDPAYRLYDPRFNALFNSYYVSAGERLMRAKRGLLSRPTVSEILNYRRYVNEALCSYLANKGEVLNPEASLILETGIHHEQQHQELLLTDIKYNFSLNPLLPRYKNPQEETQSYLWQREQWLDYPGRLHKIGHAGPLFSYDNERPKHAVYMRPYSLASLPVTNSDYLEFMRDGGYTRAEWWLSDGWEMVQREKWNAPLYWKDHHDGTWHTFTLFGLKSLDLHEPVCHVSFYEADAYARWAGARLPTEAEWEIAACDVVVAGNFRESGRLHPVRASQPLHLSVVQPEKFFGDVWEWTQSPYVPYPGFRPSQGPLSEYNGKFMCNQMVLRGGSCVTSAEHMRATYRNFFYPGQRWQFSGFRLARDLN